MQEESPQHEVLRKAQQGDRLAMGQLILENQAMVFSISLHFLRNREASEELAQEVFLSLFENFDQIRSPEHLRFWLRRVTSHRCIDWARKEKRRAVTHLEEVPEPACVEAVGDPFLDSVLQRLTASLAPKPRMIVAMRYQEDMDPMEIACVLEMPVNSVKSLLHRSLLLLKDKLERTSVKV